MIATGEMTLHVPGLLGATLNNIQQSQAIDGKVKHLEILWMEEILHHLRWLKAYRQWGKPPINWCRISSIHRMK